MKSKGELSALKEEVENMHRRLAELTEEEFAQVTGGCENGGMKYDPYGKPMYMRPDIFGTTRNMYGKSVNVNEVLT